MSNWTDVFLAATSLEDVGPEDGPESYPTIDQLNDWLASNRYAGELFLITNPQAGRHSPGHCFAGHVKNLSWEAFADAVKRIPWEWPEQIELYLRQEDDRGFQRIELWADGRKIAGRSPTPRTPHSPL